MKPLSHIVDALIATEAKADRARWFVTGAVALWLTVTLIAVIAQSPGYFSRAGAVGTGTVLAAFALVAVIRSAYHTLLEKGLILILRQHLRDVEGRPLVFEAAMTTPADREQAARDYDHSLEVLGRLFARVDRKSTPARGVEVGAAVIATLQWGYGDLVMNRFLCGAWAC